MAPAETLLVRAFRGMWTGSLGSHRRRTLARLARHERQLEAWWKCELAAHLWDHCEAFGDNTLVWIEAIKRADLALARGRQIARRYLPITDDEVCIPIELKTTGTWWGSGKSHITKALGETNKKRLEHDMQAVRDGSRPARPFAAVALLVTHVGRRSDELLNRYLNHARQMGQRNELEVVLDAGISLPVEDSPTTAHQIVWIKRS